MTASIIHLPALLLLLLSAGFTHAAPRLGPHDGSGPRPSAAAGAPRPSPGLLEEQTPSPFAVVPARPPPSPPAASTSEPSAGELDPAHVSAFTAARKRSADGQSFFFPPGRPDKTLQTLGDPGSESPQRRSDNDAWAADSPASALRTADTSQEAVCNCSSGAEGILDSEDCDPVTGQCSCVSGYSGLQCEDCEEGYFTNGTSGCLPCACDSYGAVNALCDSLGICVCKAGVYGPKCDECHPGFFHFSNTGCRPCQCNNHTSSCHPQSGVCLNCEGNTQGTNCEECRPGFHRSLSAPHTHTCSACPCSNSSSTSSCHRDAADSVVCDQCLTGYSGPHCDRCASGFYRSSSGCVPCDCSGNAELQGPGGLCHPDTGHCLRCLNGTTGARCHLCAPGFIGDARQHNCTRPAPRLLQPTPADSTPTVATNPPRSTPPPPPARLTTPTPLATTTTSSSSSFSSSTLLTSLSSPKDNTTAALTEVSWTQFNIIILAVIILVVLLLLSFVGGVYTYREYQNRKLNAPFWTIELKEDNISFSSYHDSIPNADVSGLLEDEANEVAPNGQLALNTQGNCYKA